jgi:hypothetical protein
MNKAYFVIFTFICAACIRGAFGQIRESNGTFGEVFVIIFWLGSQVV